MGHNWSVVLDRLVIILLAVILLVPPAALPFSEPVPQAFAQTNPVPTYLDTFGSKGNGNGEFGDNGPWGIDVDSLGNVWVMDYKNEHTQKFSSDGTFLLLIGSNGDGDSQFKNNGPRDVAVDSDDNFWITDTKAHQIKKFDSSGNFLLSIGSNSGDTDTKFNQPSGIAIDSSDNIYVADTKNEKIKKYDSSGNHLLTFGSKGNGDSQFENDGLFGIAIDSSNNIWITDTKAHQIKKFDSSGNFLLKFGSEGTSDTQFKKPYSIAIDSFNNIWIADTDNERIVAYDSSGNFLTKYGSKGSATGEFGSNGPKGISFESGTSIFYVTDTKNNRIYKLQNNLGAVVSVPGVPIDLTATAGDTQVSLSWITPTDDGGTMIDYYSVQSRLTGSGQWSLLGEILVTSATITGLTNDSEYEFQVSAHNSAGYGIAASVTETPISTLGIVSIEVRVNHDDDAEEDREGSNTGDMYLDSSDLELTEDGDEQEIGMRFNDITIPSTAIITSAHVQFTVDEIDSETTNLTIFAEDTDNSLRFNDNDDNISSRSKTTFFVSWSPVAWNTVGAAGDDQKTPDLKTVIQEVIDRAGWESGNSISIIITGDGQRTAESHDGDSNKAPLLQITYSTTASTTDAPTGLTATAGNEQVVLTWTAPFSTLTDYIVEYRPTIPSGFTSVCHIHPGNPSNSHTIIIADSAVSTHVSQHGDTIGECASNDWLVFSDGTGTGVTVLNLVNGIDYEFRVFAVNESTTSNASNVVTSTPVAGVTVPGIPTDLTAIVNDSQVLLTWTAPSNGGSLITDYLIEYSADGSTWNVVAHLLLMMVVSLLPLIVLNGLQTTFQLF